MDVSRFDQLSPRHRDVLRLTFGHRTTKEMARELGIEPGTAKGYCSEAVALLGLRNRREAAIAFNAYENPPEREGPSEGFAPPAVKTPIAMTELSPATWLGPLDPRNRKADNTHGALARVGWIIVLSAAIAVGFGSLASGLEVVNGIVAKLGNPQ